MRFEVYDHSNAVTMFSFETPNTEFGNKMIHLFVAEMILLHGPTFKKLKTESLGDHGTSVIYTHNITGVIKS